MKLLYLLVLLSIIFLGCNVTPSTHTEKVFENRMAAKRLTLVHTGKIEIPLDSVSLNDSAYPVYYSNDTAAYYIVGNEIINSIDFYDLDKKKLVKRNVYAKEGPEGILFTLKVFVKSLDSIYVYCMEDSRLLLTNYQGDVLKTFHIPAKFPDAWMANRVQPYKVVGDNVYFGYMKAGESYDQAGHKTMMKFNLVSGESMETGSPYPDQFKQHLYVNFLPFYTFGHDANVVVRHGALPSVFVHDLAAGTSQQIPMRSKFQDKDIVPNKEVLYVREVDHDFEQIQQSDYGGIYYDKYQHVYYSVFKKGMPLEDAEGHTNRETDKPVSLVIFNEQFEYCGEIVLKDKTYSWNYIPTAKGLLIPTANADNPENNEDVLHFDIFSLHEEK